MRETLPNAPKSGQLDLNAAVFQAPIPLQGLKTVGDLIGRIGQATHVELYADPHCAKKTLTLVGAAPVVAAGSLLRAVALCVTGAYRQVGPAFVLTDDVPGLGTRRRLWQQFEEEARERRRGPLEQAGDKLATEHSPGDLYAGADSLALTTQQAVTADGSDAWNIWGGQTTVFLPLDKLTPQQQDAARRMFEQAHRPNVYANSMTVVGGANGGATVNGKPAETSLAGNLMLRASPTLQILLPSLDGPVEMSGPFGLGNLFEPSQKLMQARMEAQAKKMQAAHPVSASRTPPIPPLSELIRRLPRRAALTDARTAAGVAALVPRMKALGLNQLWLPAFFDGRLHLDLVRAALKATKGTGIAVFPVLDLLAWGPNAPPDLCDLTLTGQTSAQAAAPRLRREQAQRTAGETPPPAAPQYVSPFAPEVRETLTHAIGELAALPAVGGLVWREEAPPGYDVSRASAFERPGGRPMFFSGSGEPLGYTLPARLAFLRQAHADPVDVNPDSGPGQYVLPAFEDQTLDTDLSARWTRFRADTDLALLRALSDARARPLPILVKQSRQPFVTDWYGSWDGPDRTLPAYRQFGEQENPGPMLPPEQDAYRQARAQSRLAFVLLPVQRGADARGLAAQLQWKAGTQPWDGVVLDLTGAAAAGEEPLVKLAAGGAAELPAAARWGQPVEGRR